MTDSQSVRPLSVAIAAGGTAGHINPALALAEELRGRGHKVVFYGQPTRLEGTLVPAAGFELVELLRTGFPVRTTWSGLFSCSNVARAAGTEMQTLAA